MLVWLRVLPPAIVALYWMLALSVDPLSAAWYLVLLVTGGSVGALTALLGCVWLAMLVVVAGIARAGADEPEAARGSAQGLRPRRLRRPRLAGRDGIRARPALKLLTEMRPAPRAPARSAASRSSTRLRWPSRSSGAATACGGVSEVLEASQAGPDGSVRPDERDAATRPDLA